MLTRFTKKQKAEESKQFKEKELAEPVTAEVHPIRDSAQDEAALKKNIADKLRNYRPVEREANFTGPKYFK